MADRACIYCGHVGSRLSDEDCPANPNRPLSAEAILAELVLDVEQAGVIEQVREEWPDLYVTYLKAKALLEGA